jgi:hypothetical protein
MQQLETINSAAPKVAATQPVQEFMRRWLTGRRGLVIGGVAIVAAGLALGWNWLSAIGVAPIILSLAPCAAMCAIGACAMMKGNSSGAKPDASIPTAAPVLTSTPPPLGKQES